MSTSESPINIGSPKTPPLEPIDNSDPIAAIMKREATLSKLVSKENGCFVHFEYSQYPGHTGRDAVTTCKLEVYTHNQLHDTSFLMFSDSRQISKSVFDTKIAQLETAIDYVKNATSSGEFLTYRVVWRKNGGKQNMSFFSGTDALDVAAKFYAGKNRHDYFIDEITIRPSS